VSEWGLLGGAGPPIVLEGAYHISLLEWVGILWYNHFVDGENINSLHIWGRVHVLEGIDDWA